MSPIGTELGLLFFVAAPVLVILGLLVARLRGRPAACCLCRHARDRHERRGVCGVEGCGCMYYTDA